MNKHTKDVFMYVLAGVIMTYAFTFMTMMLFFAIPTQNKDIVMILSGQLVVGGAAAVYSYFFGSTKGSADKTEMIAKSAPISDASTSISTPTTETKTTDTVN